MPRSRWPKQKESQTTNLGLRYKLVGKVVAGTALPWSSFRLNRRSSEGAKLRLLLMHCLVALLQVFLLWGPAEAASPEILSKPVMKRICTALVVDGWGAEALEIFEVLESRFGSCKACRKLNRKFYFSCRTALKKSGGKVYPKRLEPSLELISTVTEPLHQIQSVVSVEEFTVLSAFVSFGLAARDTRSRSYFSILDSFWGPALLAAKKESAS
jgi:hypothetical protein